MSGSWVPVIEHLATPLVAVAASELSVRYDATEKHWLMSYLDPAAGRIVLRRSASPQGVWSYGATLADAAEYPVFVRRFHASLVHSGRAVLHDVRVGQLQRLSHAGPKSGRPRPRCLDGEPHVVPGGQVERGDSSGGDVGDASGGAVGMIGGADPIA